jgi:hypothetical protein
MSFVSIESKEDNVNIPKKDDEKEKDDDKKVEDEKKDEKDPLLLDFYSEVIQV